MLRDEAAGVNDPWGFSSTATSRAVSPREGDGSPEVNRDDKKANP
jgi:hypothetical protein